MLDPGYEILVQHQYPLGKTWITTSPELYKIVFGDTIFSEHLNTIKWNIKLLEDAFLRGSVLGDLPEIRDAFITILKLMGKYKFSFEASMESFIKKLVPSFIENLEKCGGNVNQLPSEETFLLLAEAYELLCCDMDLLDRCGVQDEDLRPAIIATNDKKCNFYYFGWDLVFCTVPIIIDDEPQDSKPYAVSFTAVGFKYLFNHFISTNRRKSLHMNATHDAVSDKIQAFSLSMETKRLPSIRIQNKMRAPPPIVYEPLALRTRRGLKEPSEIAEDVQMLQKESRAARFARRQEALDLGLQQKALNEFTPPSAPSPQNAGAINPPVELDYLDLLIEDVIAKSAVMVKALKRKKRSKGANQFYEDDMFMPAESVKYIRVENLSGDVKAEVRKQMNKGRAARLEARNDPCSSKPHPSEVSLAAAITNVRQQHQSQSPQPSTAKANDEVPSMQPLQSSTTPLYKPAALKKTSLLRMPSQMPLATNSLPNISNRSPFVFNRPSPSTSVNYRPLLTAQRRMIVRSPSEPSSARFIRVIRQPSSVRQNVRYSSMASQCFRYSYPVIQPIRSLIYTNGNQLRPQVQNGYIRRVVPTNSPQRFNVPTTTCSLKPGYYHQTTPNIYVQPNNTSPVNVFQTSDAELPLPVNGRIKENGNEMPMLKHFEQANNMDSFESINGLRQEENILSANQSYNQHF